MFREGCNCFNNTVHYAFLAKAKAINRCTIWRNRKTQFQNESAYFNENERVSYNIPRAHVSIIHIVQRKYTGQIAMNKFSRIRWNGKISNITEIKLVYVIIFSIFPLRCIACTVKNEDEFNIDAYEMWLLA